MSIGSCDGDNLPGVRGVRSGAMLFGAAVGLRIKRLRLRESLRLGIGLQLHEGLRSSTTLMKCVRLGISLNLGLGRGRRRRREGGCRRRRRREGGCRRLRHRLQPQGTHNPVTEGILGNVVARIPFESA
jgi:hypothetical protein